MTTTKRIALDTRRNGNEYKAFQVSDNGFESWREIGPRAWKYLLVEDVTTEEQRVKVAWFELHAFLKQRYEANEDSWGEEYDGAALWCAKRAIKEVHGDPLPPMLSGRVFDEIENDRDAFESRVRGFAYWLARGGNGE